MIEPIANSFLSNNVRQFLDVQHADYEIIDCGEELGLVDAIKTAKICPEHVIKAIPLTNDDNENLLAIVPFYCSVDVKFISQIFGKHFRILSNKEANCLFTDCSAGSYPPFSSLYDIRSIIDEKLFEKNEIIFQSGSARSLVKMTTQSFRNLIPETNSGPISTNNGLLPGSQEHSTSNIVAEKLGIINGLEPLVDPNHKLPQLTDTAAELVNFLGDPFSTPQHISKTLADDAQLATQVLRYARATCYPCTTKIATVDDAINKALGMDTVSCIALGAATIKSFRTPRKGPIGYVALWRHAMYSATLMHALARRIPDIQVRPSTAFLIGFTQRYGMLALGHMFQFKYQTLNKMLETKSDTSFDALKVHSKVLGPTLFALNSGYASMGAWLLAEWNMPEAIVTCVGEQLNPNYNGDYASYVHLLQLSNQLLTEHGLGIDCGTTKSGNHKDSKLLSVARGLKIAKTLNRYHHSQEHDHNFESELGITSEIINEVIDSVLAGSEEIECLASRLAA